MSRNDPHDHLFKAVFGQASQASEWLPTVTPRMVRDRVSWSTLKVLPGSFVDESLSERETDLLFSCEWEDGRPCLFYVLLEHQSTRDDRMPWRMLRYLVRIWESWERDHPEWEALPLILPLVVYHGQRAWGAVPFFLLIDFPSGTTDAMRRYVPDFEFELFDLSRVHNEELEGPALAQMALRLLKHYDRRFDLWPDFFQWGELLNDVAHQSGPDALRRIFSYLVQVNDDFPDTNDFRDFLREHLDDPNDQEILMNAAQKLHERGKKEGIEQGIKQGVERSLGRQRSFLMKLLEKKFGDLPADARERVVSADQDRLERWTEGLLEAESLQQVFDK